ncbi:VOC family protein [candidate division WS5 bacterium]|uniref:VOC family protein n=1 Tax=candidate division WS5 bacterium TaxID=2093353 RepID=A0A419DE92_9BACT|nr:MAG: VOC family protein [candidate division WS5 bacterium]
MIKRLHHTAIQVENLEESIKFYESIDFKVIKKFTKEEPKAKAAFMENGAMLELWQFEDENEPQSQIIKKHIAFETDDLEGDLIDFQKNGHDIVIPVTKGVTVEQFAFVRDSKGNCFELVQLRIQK